MLPSSGFLVPHYEVVCHGVRKPSPLNNENLYFRPRHTAARLCDRSDNRTRRRHAGCAVTLRHFWRDPRDYDVPRV